MAVNSVGSGSSTSGSSTGGALDGFDADNFLKLLMTELQQQDPLNPMDNSQMLEQIGQIRSVEATDKMTKTLDSIVLAQSINSATAFIGKKITGLTDAAAGGTPQTVNGVVDRVTIADGEAKLHIGTSTISMGNVSEVTGS